MIKARKGGDGGPPQGDVSTHDAALAAGRVPPQRGAGAIPRFSLFVVFSRCSVVSLLLLLQPSRV